MSTPFPNHILRSGSHSQDLQNVPSLRRLMVDLHFMLMNVDTPADIQAMGNLPAPSSLQERIIRNIVHTIQTDRPHTVLLQAILRFVAARHNGDQAVLAATNELVTLASVPTLTDGAAHEAEYQEASRRLDERGEDVTLTTGELLQRVSTIALKLAIGIVLQPEYTGARN
jgi:hypothetical protein